MFNTEQIKFMKELGLNFDFSHLSDEEYTQIEDHVGDVYTAEVQNSEKHTTARMLLCESILDILSKR